MSEQVILGLLASAGFITVIVVGLLLVVTRFYRKVDQGRALIINTMSDDPKVTFTGGIVWPIINRAEIMDISVKTIEIDRRGKDGLICKDNIRADISVTFFVQVNKAPEDVLRVAQLIGCARASDQAIIEKLFNAKFAEALKTAGKKFQFEELYEERDKFRQEIIGVIGNDLNGFTLEDTAIDYLEQTDVKLLDEQNTLDAQGIRKITEITANQNVRTNELRQKERMEIGDQNLKADEALFQFEQRRAEAEAKKDREIASTRSREENAALRIADEEGKKTMLLRQKHEEEIAVANEAKLRGVAIAEKGREREIAVETERVEKARALESIARLREVELGSIQKDKEVEAQRKEIAEIVRGRVAVEKTVAEEEERIKDVRVIAEAKRIQDSAVISAEAEAQEQMIKSVKAAEAQEQVARLKAKETLTIAEAALEASDKEARAKMRMAEGVQAERAAAGLAEVRVKEANAVAFEKEGLAQVRVKEANSAAIEKEGTAEAAVLRQQHGAEVAAHEARGLADAKIKEAMASAIERQGIAEAVAIERKAEAEATGLAKKAESMKALDGVGREHEEFRLRLEMDKEIESKRIEARARIAEQQATVLAEAMKNAKINIVGGDGEFFNRFVQAVSLGQSADGALDHSETLKTLLAEYLNGEKSLPGDVVQVLTDSRVDSETVRNLSVSALLTKMTARADGTTQEKLRQLAEQARKLGLG